MSARSALRDNDDCKHLGLSPRKSKGIAECDRGILPGRKGFMNYQATQVKDEEYICLRNIFNLRLFRGGAREGG